MTSFKSNQEKEDYYKAIERDVLKNINKNVTEKGKEIYYEFKYKYNSFDFYNDNYLVENKSFISYSFEEYKKTYPGGYLLKYGKIEKMNEFIRNNPKYKKYYVCFTNNDTINIFEYNPNEIWGYKDLTTYWTESEVGRVENPNMPLEEEKCKVFPYSLMKIQYNYNFFENFTIRK